jgi:hypothetical protein
LKIVGASAKSSSETFDYRQRLSYHSCVPHTPELVTSAQDLCHGSCGDGDGDGDGGGDGDGDDDDCCGGCGDGGVIVMLIVIHIDTYTRAQSSTQIHTQTYSADLRFALSKVLLYV